MRGIKEEIEKIIEREAKKLLKAQPECNSEEKKLPSCFIEIPPKGIQGDLATNIAILLARKLKKPPLEIARQLASAASCHSTVFNRVKVAGGGFINFFIAPQKFHKEIKIILKCDDSYGRDNLGKGKRVQIEFVSANPTGPLHIGHGRSAAIGDSLANILEMLGYKLQREYYINDVGTQIEMLGKSIEFWAKKIKGEKCEFPEKGYKGDYIREIAEEIKSQIPQPLPAGDVSPFGRSTEGRQKRDKSQDFRKIGMKKILKEIKKDLKNFGVKFDRWFFESNLYKKTKKRKNKIQKAIDFLKKKNLIYEKKGASWFRSTKFGDDKDRVVIRDDGRPTYLASDMAYHFDKFKRDFQKVIDIWGQDHHGYVKRINGAAQAFGKRDNLSIILYQLVNLLRGKKLVSMSTREGEFVTLREVMDEVGKDACRYLLLMRGANSPLDFDLELAKKKSLENPVYYVQYAHARISSIFKEAKKQDTRYPPAKAKRRAGKIQDTSNLELLKKEEELEIMKKLAFYPDIVKTCGRRLEPHHLTGYLLEIARKFHHYYDNCRVISSHENLTRARLAFIKAIQIVIRNGLNLLGISAPEHM